MADYVSDIPGGFSFKWGEPWTQQDTKSSQILRMDKNKRIRLKWDNTEEEGDFWEMKIEKSELTGKFTLIITDHAEEDDIEYIKTFGKRIWTSCIRQADYNTTQQIRVIFIKNRKNILSMIFLC
jgi:hypothetical protein